VSTYFIFNRINILISVIKLNNYFEYIYLYIYKYFVFFEENILNVKKHV